MIKVISIFQIIGGIIGIAFISITFVKNWEFEPVLLVGIFSICFYIYSLFCGITLLKPGKGSFKYTIVNQLLQVFHISVPEFSFQYVSGLSMNVGFSFMDKTTMDFGAGLSVFKFVLNQDTRGFFIGLNLVALFFLYQLRNIRRAALRDFAILKD